jgi:hypothetical protein
MQKGQDGIKINFNIEIHCFSKESSIIDALNIA